MVRKKIEKIMLIFPTGKVVKGHFQHCEIPLGLAYLAAVLRDNNFQVKVLDGRTKFKSFIPANSKWEYFGFTQEEIIEEVENYAPQVVGISCLSSFHFSDVVVLFRLIKQLDPNILTVIGGSHPTFLAEQVMNNSKDIDFVILGEGEESFSDLLMNISSGADYRNLDGLAFRIDGKICVNPKTRYIENLNNLPYPALDLFPLDFYRKKSVPFSTTFRSKMCAPILTSRGCVADCIFCASKNFWGNVYRRRTAANVLDEINFLIDRYGIKEIQFIDDNLTLDRKRARDIFKGIIDRNFKISWNTPNGIAVWTMDEEMLNLMKESGCYEVTVAFESGVQQVIDKIIKKPINLQKAALMVEKMKKLGIQVNGFFISGFPGETKKQVLETFSFAEKVDLDSAYFFIANPTPGSELLKICEEKGYLRRNFRFDDIEYNLPNIQTPEFTPREIEKMVLKQFNIFHFRILLRHPFRFLRKFLKMFLAHPIMTFRTLFVDLVRIAGK